VSPALFHTCAVYLLQTFTTQETITNATSAKMWLLDKLHDVSLLSVFMTLFECRFSTVFHYSWYDI